MMENIPDITLDIFEFENAIDTKMIIPQNSIPIAIGFKKL